MISHNEAQTLISARQDQRLDPLVERELNAHLATCDTCRAFAQSTDALTQGLRTLPYLPASPAVRNAVLDRVEQGRSPFARIASAFNTAPGPALSTLAIIALVLVLAFFAVNRFLMQDPDNAGDIQQLASQPTEQAIASETAAATGEVFDLVGEEATPTAEATDSPTEEATEAPTEAPTDVPATETPTAEPTSQPTEEPEPTETPEPTAEPEPTETPEPTAEPTVEPTEEPDGVGGAGDPSMTLQGTADPTATSTPEEEVVDLTTATATDEPTPEPTATATAEPTQTPEPTVTATVEPTATPDPTSTPAPTEAPTVAPTQTPEPTQEPTEDAAPPIVPITGDPIDPQDDGETERAGTDSAETPSDSDSKQSSSPRIEPIGDGAVIDPSSGEDDEAEETETPAIESIAPDEASTPENETPDETPETVETVEIDPEATRDLEEASERYQDIAGDPSGRLVLTGDGRMIFADRPHVPDTTTAAGRTLETVDAEGGPAVALCDPNGACTDVSSASREGAAEDVGLAVMGGDVLYVRYAGGAVEYRSVTVEGEMVLEDTLLLEGDSSIAPQGAVYEEEETLWIPVSGGSWVMMDENSATLLESGFADPQLVRLAQTGNGFLMGFASGGQLVVAPAEQPGSPILQLPFNGVDFDMAPSGTQVAISTGTSIDIYSTDGSLVASYVGDDMAPGTVLWLNSGIVYQDQGSGALYQIPETAN